MPKVRTQTPSFHEPFDRTRDRIDTRLSSTEIDASAVKFQASAISIRSPSSDDIAALAHLFSEMLEHYRRPVTWQQAIDAAEIACRPPVTMFDPKVLLAVTDDAVVGSIVLNVTFPAFELSRALYIRDLYIARSARRTGVGQMLVSAAARLTYDQGYSALDWTTETGNNAARQMYESCGARVLPRTYYRLAREDLTART